MRRNGVFYLSVAFLAGFAILVLRLLQLTVVQADTLQEQAEAQRLRSFDYYQYARGDFYDTLGRSLTSNEESCLVVFPTMIEDSEKTAAALAVVLDIDEDIIHSRLEDNNSRTLEPYILKTGLSSTQTAAISEGKIRFTFSSTLQC